ncbi:MAG: ABC transporter ATP-binding protein/permease [Clostridiales bacterium]|jgi:ABC-type lipoprotein export system ATPase subunit/cell division protein FtsX|nr:ABC transporter ATP-binding protein/permease [Clostridiales bacterium]
MISIRNLCKTYYPKSGNAVRALYNVSLDLPETGMVFILGKSGSGKSTFLNVLGGLDRYDSGEIIIKGKSSGKFSQSDFDSYRNTFIGFIFQEYNILQDFTVAKNIALALELQGKRGGKAAVEAILEQVDLKGYGKRKPNELSGGQKQRVAIARALIKNPDIIMADEPSGALDSNTGRQVFETLKRLSATKLVIVVSHDREYAEQFGDRIVEFADGVIVNDVTKYYAPPQAHGAVSVTDGRILTVKAGQQLTEADARAINQFIANARTDTIISADPDANMKFKRAARINDAGDKESFAGTEFVTLRPYQPKDFKLIRSRLPWKDSFRMGASGLKTKPVRLVFTILLSAIAFALFGLADTLGAYDKVNATLTSLEQSSIKQAVMVKQTEYVNEGSNYSYYNEARMAAGDIAKLNERDGYQGKFKGAYGDGFSIGDTYKLDGYSQYYASSFGSFFEMDTATMETLGLSLNAGALPATTGQIAVSEYIFRIWKEKGFYDRSDPSLTDAQAKHTVNNYNDIIGKKLRMSKSNNGGGNVADGADVILTITGVVDTGFNFERYKPLAETERQSGFTDYFLYSELSSMLNYGLHGAAFVGGGFYDGVYKANASPVIRFNNGGQIYPGTTTVNKGGGTNAYPIGNLYYGLAFDPSLLSTEGLTVIWQNGAAKTSLTDGEVVLSIQALQELNIGLAWDWNDVYARTDMLIAQYVNTVETAGDYANNADINQFIMVWNAYRDEYNEPYGKFTQPYDYDEVWQIYKGYLESHNSFLDYNEKGSALDKGYRYFESRAHTEIKAEAYAALASPHLGQEFWISIWTGRGNVSKKVKLVGIAVLPDNFNLYDGLVVGTQSLLAELNPDVGDYKFAVAPLSGNRAENLKLVKFSYETNGGVMYSLRNEVTATLSQVNDMVESLSKIFLYVGVFFAVFASLLMLNFIATSISYKKREIGVLRAVGARSGDVFGIFFNESFLIACINFLIAAVAVFGVSTYLNSYFRGRLGLLITLLYFGIRQIALIFAVSVAAAFIASFIPTIRISSKKPIDAINNR